MLPADGQLVSLEKDLSWLLVAKRFLWQASQGEKDKQRQRPLASKVSHARDCTTTPLPAAGALQSGRVTGHGPTVSTMHPAVLLCCIKKDVAGLLLFYRFDLLRL